MRCRFARPPSSSYCFDARLFRSRSSCCRWLPRGEEPSLWQLGSAWSSLPPRSSPTRRSSRRRCKKPSVGGPLVPPRQQEHHVPRSQRERNDPLGMPREDGRRNAVTPHVVSTQVPHPSWPIEALAVAAAIIVADASLDRPVREGALDKAMGPEKH